MQGAFEVHSRMGRLMAAIRVEVAYLMWLTQCWQSHRAAKVTCAATLIFLSVSVSPQLNHAFSTQVIRLEDLDLPTTQRSVPLHVLHLVRSPAAVSASRLSLASFSGRSAFNARGEGGSGVVSSVCASMDAKLTPPRNSRYALANFSYRVFDYDR